MARRHLVACEQARRFGLEALLQRPTHLDEGAEHAGAEAAGVLGHNVGAVRVRARVGRIGGGRVVADVVVRHRPDRRHPPVTTCTVSP